MKLLKQKDIIRYNKETFTLDYGIEPIKIIDLKALAGDASPLAPWSSMRCMMSPTCFESKNDRDVHMY